VRIAVDKEHVVAFAPPAVLVFENGHGDANEVSLAGGLHPDIVVPAVEIFYIVDSRIAIVGPSGGPPVIRLSLPELRMEIKSAVRQRMGLRAVIEVEIEGVDGFLAFVCDGNQGVLLKWHGEERVHRAFVGYREKF
jgi:hypothetical protein